MPESIREFVKRRFGDAEILNYAPAGKYLYIKLRFRGGRTAVFRYDQIRGVVEKVE